ncbi:hypothetical protein [[Clostridium] scindens]|uniref:hypothetical protein n=1 Tax=Clostridium scindens (strain JCM 10418 / VPI 12708) TaxID=29347 RepID=UPI00298C4BBC|nr:hypothetical protein [[Clostridium] scindens]
MNEIKKKRKTPRNKIKYIVCDINTASKILPVKKIETDTKIRSVCKIEKVDA